MVISYYIEVPDLAHKQAIEGHLRSSKRRFIDNTHADPLCQKNSLAEVAVELHLRETQPCLVSQP